MLICPVCKRPLAKEGKTFRCQKGHSYDIAAQGYVNLLQANKKSSANPGDNPEMVAGRTRFLESGGYEPLSNLLNDCINDICGPAARILDLGCGEGYYTARLWNLLTGKGKEPALYGVDLSRTAVRRAARRVPGAQFFIASLFDLPFLEGTADICYNVFSPLCPGEITRVLPPGGYLVAVYPAARHLFGLKKILYDRPYENPEESYEVDGLQILERKRLVYPMTLKGQELIRSLYTMTPYFYKTPRAGAERLEKMDLLETEADFWMVVYRRNNE